MNINGFTLLEMLVVSLIIGILAAIALPKYQLAVEKARAAEAVSIVRSLRDAQLNYFLVHGRYSSNINDMDISIPGEDGIYAEVPEKESKNFSFAVKSTEGELAVASRKPIIKDYIIKAQGQQLGCRVYSDFGRQVCKSFGGEQVADRVGQQYEVYEVK